MQPATDPVLLDLDDGVATVTLNRPDKRNAWSWEIDNAFRDIIQRCEKDDAVRAVVVTGAGDAFCAGADLAAEEGVFSEEWLENHPKEPVAERYGYWTMRTPIIAAINGAAIGAGMTIPLLFDIRFAATDAKLSLRFPSLGITADANCHWILPRLVGAANALDLLLTARTISGEEAAAMGLVSKALPRHEVLPAAQECAHRIAANTAPLAVAASKQLLYRALQETDRGSAFEAESDIIAWLMSQPDCAEGIRALLERRQAQWSMSKNAELPDPHC